MFTGISVDGFKCKPESKVEVYSKIKFIERDIDISELYDLLINGHSIQCCFGIEGEYTTAGLLKKESFKQTNIVAIDIDGSEYCWLEIKAKITSTPTIMYTTFSNGIEGKGYRYRLIYVFDQPIYSLDLYSALANSIVSGLGITVDDCSKYGTQMMHGTNKDAEGFNSKLFNKVFSFSSFLDETTIAEITNTNNYNGPKYKNGPKGKYSTKEKNTLRCSHIYTQDQNSNINATLIGDAASMEYRPFFHKYNHTYPYIYRTEKEEWIDYSYQIIADNYIRLPYFVKKIGDGKMRKNLLYKNAIKRKYIKPDVDIDTLFYCMVIDLHKFIDNTINPLTVNDLIRLTTKAFNGEIYDNSPCIEEARKKAPKSQIILKRGTYKDVGDYMHQVSLIKEQLTGIERCRMTNYRDRKKAGLVVSRNSEADYNEIYDKIDVSLSRAKNSKRLKEMGYKIGNQKLNDMLNKKREATMNNN